MSNERVDVLAVMAKARGTELATEMWQARCAVAELIEADREYDEALDARNNPPNKRMKTLQEIEVRWARAICRRAEALDRIGAAQ